MAEGTRSKKLEGEKEQRATGEHRKDDYKPTPQQASAANLKKAAGKAEKEATLAALRHSLTPKKASPKGSPAQASATGNLTQASSSGLLAKAVPPLPGTEKTKETAEPAPPPGVPPPLQADLPSATTDPLTSLLAQMAALNTKLDTLATKADLNSLQNKLTEHVNETVEAAVQPVRTQVEDLNTRVEKLEQGSNSKPTRNDPSDPAHKRVSFLGFPDTCAAEERLAEMQRFVQKFPLHSPLAVSNKYTGPYNNRSCSKHGFAEFADRDARDNFLKAAKETSFTVKGVVVGVKKAKTSFNGQRDYSLYKAADVLKAAAPGKSVTLERDSRTVAVDKVCAFKQEKDETGGTFCGGYSHLSLA